MNEQSTSLPLNYRWRVMGIVMIGTLLSALNASIVNVSLPALMADFGAGLDDIQWVVTAYMIAFATLMPLTSWFRDKIGYKKLYIASLATFTIGSLLCGVAWNLPTLLCARVIQALGGGAITPTGMAMITEVFPPREKGKAIGIWGMGVVVGPAVGPTIGGYLTQTFGWRSIFLINIPIGIIACFAAMKILAEDKLQLSGRKPFDIWGFISLSVFLVAFLLGVSKGASKGWTSTYIITCGIISILSFIVFMLAELNISYGIIDFSLFSSPVFSACSVISVARSIALYGGMFLLPLFIQQQMGYDEMDSGLMLLPGSLLMAALMPICGKIGDKTGPKYPTIFGMACLAVFMFMYAHADPMMSVFAVIAPTLIRGVGFAFLMAPMTTAAMNAVPKSKVGMASSMLSIFQQIGGSIGIMIMSTVLSNRVHYHLEIIGGSLQKGSTAASQAVSSLSQYIHTIGYTYVQSAQIAQMMIMQKISQAAVVMSFQDAFIVGGLIVTASISLAFLLPKKVVHHKADLQAKEETGVEISSSD
jgi:MFS transporter, DHA2 family, multidrug resistance protein